MRRILSTACIVLIAACGDPDSGSTLSVQVTELSSPAGEGSGEAFLSSSGDAVHMTWLEEAEEGMHDLRIARLENGVWSPATVVASRADFFVNWADFPSVAVDEGGRLWIHWLQRGPEGGYDYGIRLVHSEDGGDTWSEPWTPHEDATPTEHGFVSLLPLGGGVALSWLDGRQYAPGPDGSPATQEMTVRFRALDNAATPGPETLLDPRVCDCCQTDAALAADGPVVVYRDRSPSEIRDIYLTRWVDGNWVPGTPVHDDGWEIAGCPVNGPAVAAVGDTVAVAWFTAAQENPRVHVAYSLDGGATFGPPARVDDGNPAGRVDLALDATGPGSCPRRQ
jgi:hypothetical protein